jgi:hypothetical protein
VASLQTFNSVYLDESNHFKAPDLFTLISNSDLRGWIGRKIDHYLFKDEKSAFAQFLLQNETISNYRFQNGFSLKANIYFSGYKMIGINLSAYDRGFRDAKVLGHVCCANGKVKLDGTQFLLRGFHYAHMFAVLAEGCENFFKENVSIFNLKEQQQMIDAVRAVEKPAALMPVDELVSAIQSGKMTFIGAGWDEHTIFLGFCNDQMVIGNTGEGSEGDIPHLAIFDIDPKRITSELITYIEELRSANFEFAQPFFYEELPKILRPDQHRPKIYEDCSELNKSDCDFFEKYVQEWLEYLTEALLPDAEVGNCTFESAKAALVFAAMVLKQLTAKEQLVMELIAVLDASGDTKDTDARGWQTFIPIIEEIQAIYTSIALDHFVSYCDRYYSQETGLPREEMVHLAVPIEVLQECWASLKFKTFLADREKYFGIHRLMNRLFETHPNLGLARPISL